jgi:hypothetical protein
MDSAELDKEQPVPKGIKHNKANSNKEEKAAISRAAFLVRFS